MNDGQEYLICPFDNVHKILKHRMAKHLIQCKKNHPNTKLQVCPFNNIHYILPQNMEEHLKECEDRINLDRQIYRCGPAASSIDSLIPTQLPLVTEDWDDASSANAPSYLSVRDQRNLEKPILLMGETNVGKATRKNFHRSEQQRISELQNKKQ